MRIARIIEYFPPHIGGMERHGLILSEEQIKLGHEVDVYIGVGGLKPNSKLKSDFKNSPKSDFVKLDFEIHKMPLQFLPLYSKARRFWFNIWAYFAVKKHHKRNPYSIIHLHGDFVEAYFGGKLSKKLRIPAILTIHAGLNKKLLKPENKKYFENIKKIICVSREIANELKIIGIAEEKIEIISSGVYLSGFKDVDKNAVINLRDKYSKPIIISVGVLRINKGFSYLIGSFKEILNKFDSATLLIIGDGLIRYDLEKQAQGIPNIYFLGQQEHNEVVKYLCASDIFILSSISTEGDREGTPTSIMEAMAAGLPVIAANVGGSSYLIKDGENGLLVEEKNSNELARAMIKLIGDENLRQKIKMKNLEDIKQKDWPIIVKKITDVYFQR
ncbi:MAG: glycosyltransferase family 4 protein [Candidatus Falkowbacteria bacterium]